MVNVTPLIWHTYGSVMAMDSFTKKMSGEGGWMWMLYGEIDGV